jgi:hypothetical protein
MKRIALIGSGPAARSPVARLLPGSLGPVKGLSYRTAVRLTGSLRAGIPVKEYSDLAHSPAIFVCVPDESLANVVAELASSGLSFTGKCVVLCDAAHPTEALDALRNAGAAAASLNEVHDQFIVEGDSLAVRFVKRFLRQHRVRPIELNPGTKADFFAGIEFSGELMMPLAAAALNAFQLAGLDRSLAAKVMETAAGRALRSFITAGRKGWSPPLDIELPHPELNEYRKQLVAAAASVGYSPAPGLDSAGPRKTALRNSTFMPSRKAR